MAYSVNSITTVADCDAILNMAGKEKNDLLFKKSVLQRQQQDYASSSVEVDVELLSVTTELNNLNTFVPTLPEGEMKQDQLVKQKKLEWRKQLLNNKKADYGVVALLDKEFELACVDKSLLEADDYIAAVTARKAAL